MVIVIKCIELKQNHMVLAGFFAKLRILIDYFDSTISTMCVLVYIECI